MSGAAERDRTARRLLWAAAAVFGAFLVFLVVANALVPALATRVLRERAAERGLAVSWSALRFGLDGEVYVRALAATPLAGGEPLVTVNQLSVGVKLLPLFAGRIEPSEVELYDARIVVAARRRSDEDPLGEANERPAGRRESGPAAPKVRRAAESLVHTMLLPARAMPSVRITNLEVAFAPDSESSPRRGALATPPRKLLLHQLLFEPAADAVTLTANGRYDGEQPLGFDGRLEWTHDDRLTARGRVTLPALDAARTDTLRLGLEGALHQDRRAGVVRLADSTHFHVGEMRWALSGEVRRDGPAFRFRLAADGLDERRFKSSLPSAVLGPLLEVGVTGTWDYALEAAVNLAEPDSATFNTRVVPHGLQLDGARTQLRLATLDEPFEARIHLPRHYVVTRVLDGSNPYYRPLAAIDSNLVHAVLANEDGGFFRHRGFNTEAVRLAIAHNLRQGAYARGAGTVTMQLARNLYLGHERTLSRKGQEVVLAWVLEHLTGVTKERLLEIYLNIIEWGPGIHGAGEAAAYYFGTTPERLTIEQALFLTTVIPSPNKWTYRLDADGALRPFERAQMHFIGRAMIAKGWLAPDALPPADSLRVAITGQAADDLQAPPAADRTPLH